MFHTVKDSENEPAIAMEFPHISHDAVLVRVDFALWLEGDRINTEGSRLVSYVAFADSTACLEISGMRHAA